MNETEPMPTRQWEKDSQPNPRVMLEEKRVKVEEGPWLLHLVGHKGAPDWARTRPRMKIQDPRA